MKRIKNMQNKIYLFIVDYIREQGYPPSVREIGDAVGLKSPSTVHAHLKTLSEAGLIQKGDRKGRALAPVTSGRGPASDMPENMVPILGVVTAGQPVLAFEDIEGYLPYDTGGRPDDYFSLRVRGESMLGAGILDGDLVVVRKQPTAHSGEIVVALLEEEATVKRLRTQNGRVWLMPANDAYEPIDGTGCSILGKVEAVFRKY